MTKRFSKLAALIMVVVALMAFVGMQASATDTEIEELEARSSYYKNTQGVVFEITSGTEHTLGVNDETGFTISETDVVIAEQYTIDGEVYTVTSIGDYAFCGFNLSSVVIPSSVTSIGYQAFAYYGVELTINYTGTEAQWAAITIDDDAFFLTTVTIICSDTTPEEDEDTPDTTGIETLTVSGSNYANSQGVKFFITNSDEKTLRAEDYTPADVVADVVIDAQYMIDDEIYTVNAIGMSVFYNCDELQSIVIPTSVTTIYTYAFMNCGTLTINYAGTEEQWAAISIDDTVFDGTTVTIICSDTTEIETLTEIWDSCYQDTQGVLFKITSETDYTLSVDECGGNIAAAGADIVIAEKYIIDGEVYTVTSIGDYAFMGSNLASVVIPSSVTSIGDYAFMRTNLESIVIPSSVTSIGDSAFRGTNLESIVIPTSVTSIGDYAFAYVNEDYGDAFTVNYAGTEEQWDAITKGDGVFSNTTVTVICSDTTTDETTPEVEDEDTEDTEEELGFFAKIFAYIQLIIEYITSIFNSGSSIIG